MILSSTTIKAFLSHGNVKDYCPRYVKEVIIDRTYDISSEAILKGNFFETLCLGRGRDGKLVETLPLKKNGEPTIDQIRIQKQSENFKRLCHRYGIVLDESNTQVFLRKKLREGIFLEGHPDIVPVAVEDPELGKVLATIDLKLAKTLRNTFKEFCWGDYDNYDDIQAQTYSFLVEDLDLNLNDHLNKEIFEYVVKRGKEMEFYYWIFSFYEGKYKGERIPLENTVIRARKNELKRKELFESLKKTYKLILHHDSEGWKPVPGDVCERCPVDCPLKIPSDTIKKERKTKREKFKKELGKF